MKQLQVTTASRPHDPVLENLIANKFAELKDLAEKTGRHFGETNMPEPNCRNVAPFLGELNAGCEKLGAEVSRHHLPESHLPEGKMDIDHFKEKDATLNKEITTLEDKNHDDGFDLKNFTPAILYAQLRLAVLYSFIIMLGEIIFNTKAFQVTGENMLVALILSISVSFAVVAFSHFAAFIYKAAKSPSQRKKVVVLSLAIATAVFIALAIFRSWYLAGHGVQISPVYFVIINLFFFLVTALISLHMLPTWGEIKENFERLKLYHAIRKREKEIENLKKEKESIRQKILESSKWRVKEMHYAQYCQDMVRKMYHELVAIFIRTNLTYRKDRQTPACFTEAHPEPDIPGFTFNGKPTKNIPS
jgi:hypothetical protein